MLKNIAIALSSPKYQGLIQIDDSSVIISNQYIFLWNVLPKITGKFTRRTQFAKQMRSFGFELVSDKSAANKQNNDEKAQEKEKTLIFRAKNNEYLSPLRNILSIKQRKMAQKQKLDQKLKNLTKSFENIKNSSEQNRLREFQLVEEVSSLKEINRTIFMLNSEMNELIINSFEVQYVRIHQQTTFELLNHCINNEKPKPAEKYKLYSMQMLEQCCK